MRAARALRSEVAHARGVVNKVFLQRQPMSGHSLGERLKFDRSQIAQDLLFLARAVARVDVAAVEKFKIDQSTLRDRPKRRCLDLALRAESVERHDA